MAGVEKRDQLADRTMKFVEKALKIECTIASED
jgi:hypothetical protein